MVHQHSSLVPAFTLAENLVFGDRAAGFLFRPRAARARLLALAERFGIDVALDARVESLSVGQRQRAEILRALERGARVLILDEPTAVLTPGEARALFPILERLREAGRAVIFISHKLEEIREIGDRVVVLRQGRVVGSADPRETSSAELGRLMLGRTLPALSDRGGLADAGAPTRLSLSGLCAPGLRAASRLRELALDARGGEIVGVAGIDGNGQRELEEVLAGVRRADSGELEIDGRRCGFGMRALRAAGAAHLSGERERGGLVSGMSLLENLVLKGSFDDARFFSPWRFHVEAAREHAVRVLEEYDVQPPDPDADIATLSGGNAQKVAAARELQERPGVLVAVNPTRGLDVGSARFIHEQLLALRADGSAIVLISTELDEVLALADRVVALVEGRLLEVPDGADAATIGTILLGGAAPEGEARA